MESETGGKRPLGGPSPAADSATPANSEDDSTTNTGVSTESSESDIVNGAQEGDTTHLTTAAKEGRAKHHCGDDRKKRTKERQKSKRKSARNKGRSPQQQQQQQQPQQQQLQHQLQQQSQQPPQQQQHRSSNGDGVGIQCVDPNSMGNAAGFAAGLVGLRCEEKGSVDDLEVLSHRVYVTSTQIGVHIGVDQFFEKFREVLGTIIGSGRFRLYQTASGLIATFCNEEDLNQVLAADLAKKQGVPVQVCKFTRTGPCYRRYVMIGRVPWCVPMTEVRSALLKQGLYPGKVSRVHGDIRVELYNSSDVERLLLEGFNFYDSACYPTTLESMVNVKARDQEVVQCYRCQGYWHTSSYCHEKPRCVRCGGNHELDYCLRPRSDPTCCHCGGPHHAAYKMCPVRARVMKSTQIAFSLTKAGYSSPF